jgi:hypothetical protein
LAKSKPGADFFAISVPPVFISAEIVSGELFFLQNSSVVKIRQW